jgi:hypothetical protein
MNYILEKTKKIKNKLNGRDNKFNQGLGNLIKGQ